MLCGQLCTEMSCGAKGWSAGMLREASGNVHGRPKEIATPIDYVS
jgi:hypothetical protein